MSRHYFNMHDGQDADDLETVDSDFIEVFHIFGFSGDPINVMAMQRWERLVNKLIIVLARRAIDDCLLADASHVLADDTSTAEPTRVPANAPDMMTGGFRMMSAATLQTSEMYPMSLQPSLPKELSTLAMHPMALQPSLPMWLAMPEVHPMTMQMMQWQSKSHGAQMAHSMSQQHQLKSVDAFTTVQARSVAPQILPLAATASAQLEPLPQASPIDIMQMMHWQRRSHGQQMIHTMLQQPLEPSAAPAWTVAAPAEAEPLRQPMPLPFLTKKSQPWNNSAKGVV